MNGAHHCGERSAGDQGRKSQDARCPGFAARKLSGFRALDGRDVDEGIAAVREGRPPRFTGRYVAGPGR
jgi:hypothetical protein